MNADLIASAIGAGLGASSSVFIVFKILMTAIREARNVANQAHIRIDKHLESHH